MPFERLKRNIFELIDLWTISMSEVEYESFLFALFSKVRFVSFAQKEKLLGANILLKRRQPKRSEKVIAAVVPDNMPPHATFAAAAPPRNRPALATVNLSVSSAGKPAMPPMRQRRGALVKPIE
eukprot:comp17535_c0_seq1/m.29804 comp17535_c0_seq1/g.29804  ORF comp17535_c0_seq1/g.29804 comp17535_c0_seq1/m.29804 type:complete len:124 (-) comp17535_c0_seq1:46-417(-)